MNGRLWKTWKGKLKLGRWAIGAAAGSGMAMTGNMTPAARANDCSINDSNETVEVTNDGVTIRVYYDEGNCANVGEWPQSYAETLRDETNNALNAYWDLSFPDPYQNGFPEYKVVADPTDLSNAHAPGSCTTYGTDMTNNDTTPCVVDEDFMKMVTQHEMFHHIQKRFACDVNDDCSTGGWGTWIIEGTARYMQDKLFSDLDSSDYSFAGFMDEINSTMNVPETSLLDLSYKACLFWEYCGSHLGDVNSEPEQGYDFVLELFENLADGADTNESSALDALEDTIDDNGGTSLADTWLDYAIANYTKNLDLSKINDADNYRYLDENQWGEGNWDSPDTIAAGMPSNLSSSIDEYAINYYVATPDATICTAVGYRGVADDTIGWAVIGVNAADQVVGISKGFGKEFGRTFISTPDSPITRLVAVVAGLDSGSDFEQWFDFGEMDIDIDRPDLTHPEYVHIDDTYRPILVQVEVDGPDDLKPEGLNPRSVMGLRPEDFTAEVGGVDATVVAADYVGQFYFLVVAVSDTLPEGIYDVTISLCGTAGGPSVTDTNPASVIISDIVFNHVLVLDQSGSMGDPTGTTKLDAARIAAGLYADSVSDHDRIGLVSFNGNQVDCDDDAFIRESLDFATGGQRTDILNDLAGLSATGWTSIGDGLWKGQDQLDAFLGLADAHYMVLLSDGLENEARYWNVFDGCDSAWSRLQNDETVVHAYAFGPDADEPLMTDISGKTGGDYRYIDVTASGMRGATGSMANDLAEAYMGALESTRDLERIFFGSGDLPTEATVKVTITEPDLQDVIFFFNAGDLGAKIDVDLYDPDGVLVPGTVATKFEADTHVVYHFVGSPKEGSWTAELTTVLDTDYIAGVLGRNPKSPRMEILLGSAPNGGYIIDGKYCDYEQGLPVTLLARLYDVVGPILGADVVAIVERPDGTTTCSVYRLVDDGSQNDGQPNDGLYGFVYTETSIAGGAGASNDGQDPPPVPGTRGSYQVQIEALGVSNSGVEFERSANTSFRVCPSPDRDADSMPDTWEIYYGTDGEVADEFLDPDMDLLLNRDEFHLGTDPFDADSDGDGELDGSEVMHGRCPTNPDDLFIKAPVDVEFVLDPGDGGEPLPGTGNLLRFPWRNTYGEMVIERSIGTPDAFAVLTTVKSTPETPIPTNYLDEDVTPYKEYHYQFRAIGVDGGITRYSRIVSGKFIPDCNQNGIDDADDINSGTSKDADGNGIPDECEGKPCEGDANGDETVDPLDVGFVQSRFGCPVGTGDADCDVADVNGDGVVDPLDVGYVMSRFGGCL